MRYNQGKKSGRDHAIIFSEARRANYSLFPERDLPYYDAAISPAFVEGMNGFARDVGILSGYPAYEQVVARQFANLWTS